MLKGSRYTQIEGILIFQIKFLVVSGKAKTRVREQKEAVLMFVCLLIYSQEPLGEFLHTCNTYFKFKEKKCHLMNNNN